MILQVILIFRVAYVRLHSLPRKSVIMKQSGGVYSLIGFCIFEHCRCKNNCTQYHQLLHEVINEGGFKFVARVSRQTVISQHPSKFVFQCYCNKRFALPFDYFLYLVKASLFDHYCRVSACTCFGRTIKGLLLDVP